MDFPPVKLVILKPIGFDTPLCVVERKNLLVNLCAPEIQSEFSGCFYGKWPVFGEKKG